MPEHCPVCGLPTADVESVAQGLARYEGSQGGRDRLAEFIERHVHGDYEKGTPCVENHELAEAIIDAGFVVEPVIDWNEWVPNDGEFEYTSTSDCDGSNERQFKRTPEANRAGIPVGPWIPATEEEHARAVEMTNARFAVPASTTGSDQ